MNIETTDKKLDECKAELGFDRQALVNDLGFDPSANNSIEEKRPKLKLPEETTTEVIFDNAVPMTTEYGPTVMYLVKHEGEDKVFFSGSKRLKYCILKQNVQPGDKIAITKEGFGTDLTYKIEKL